MRFEAAVSRLSPPPASLPDAPAALRPVFLATGERVPRLGDPIDGGRPAAVLVLLYPGAEGEARIVLTERVDRGGHHSGEVSFPGGRVEDDDPDHVATAIREATEEVGLDPAAVDLRVLGTLPSLVIPVSGYAVTPVVAIAARPPALVAQPTEVARILRPPIAAFLPDAPLVLVEREVRGIALRYAAYPIDGLTVWGLTARILGGIGAHLAAG